MQTNFPGCREIEYFRQAFPGWGKIEYFSGVWRNWTFPGCGKIEYFRQAFLGCAEIETFKNNYFPSTARLNISDKLFSGVERLNIFEKLFARSRDWIIQKNFSGCALWRDQIMQKIISRLLRDWIFTELFLKLGITISKKLLELRYPNQPLS